MTRPDPDYEPPQGCDCGDRCTCEEPPVTVCDPTAETMRDAVMRQIALAQLREWGVL